MSGEPQVGLRADAKRNRDKLVEAAHVAFVSEGVGVPMEKIARRAGVGVGTLYRHFADREQLIAAVVARSLQRLVDLARRELVVEPDPLESLRAFMRGCVELRIGVPLFALWPRIAEAMRGVAEFDGVRDEILVRLEAVMDAAKERGRLRSDVGVGDIAIMVSMVLQREERMSHLGLDWAPSRLIEIIIAGLRASPDDPPLPGRPITDEDLDKDEVRPPA